MNVRTLFACCLLLIISTSNGYAQSEITCAISKQHQKLTGAKTSAYIPESDNYDITYVKFDISLNLASTLVNGVVTTAATVVSSSPLSVYAFELNPSITIDSVKVNGALSAVTTTGTVRKATLTSPVNFGKTIVAEVYYHGSSAAGTGQFFKGGLNPVTDGGFKLMYSLSDKDLASDWWPAKQNIQDKIDSVDMWVTVDDTLKVGSNGLLIESKLVGGGKIRYKWKTSYPIEYYLISVAVAPYAEYSYYMHYTDGSNDSMLVQNYIYNTPGHFTPIAKNALDSTGLIIDYFSKIFTRYPFYKEKHGHCMTPLSGGMEHQTMVTMGTSAYGNVAGLVAHELGHQWWGDNVTYASWKDIWLSEGFASYCEQLFVEHFRGAQAFFDYRTGVFNKSFSNTGKVYVDDTTDVYRIFDGTLTYNKGAAVVHMLRYLAPNDSTYFAALRTYQQTFKNSIAYTSDLQNILEQAYNTDLDTFFNQWIYGSGYPIYSAKWYQDGQKVMIQLKQEVPVGASVSCFKMPVELKLITTQGDRIVKVDNTSNLYTYVFSCDSTVTGIQIDPNNHILDKQKTITKDASVLRVEEQMLNNVCVYPNPSKDEWQVKNMPPNATLRLCDVTGKMLLQQQCTGNINISSKNLAPGNYVLTVISGDNNSKNIKLIKY